VVRSVNAAPLPSGIDQTEELQAFLNQCAVGGDSADFQNDGTYYTSASLICAEGQQCTGVGVTFNKAYTGMPSASLRSAQSSGQGYTWFVPA
jgi:hypothetical protein